MVYYILSDYFNLVIIFILFYLDAVSSNKSVTMCYVRLKINFAGIVIDDVKSAVYEQQMPQSPGAICLLACIKKKVGIVSYQILR